MTDTKSYRTEVFMQEARKRNILMLVINLYIVLSTAVIVFLGVTGGAGAGQVGEGMRGAGYLKAFTNLSNILAAAASAAVLYYNIRNLKDRTDELPRRVLVLQYAGASAVGLTFLVVLCFLGPLFQLQGKGYFTMYSGEMFFFHLLNPVLCSVELVLLERKHVLTLRDNLTAVVPAFLYSLLYLMMVVILRQWSDFYNFTFGGRYWVSPLTMLAIYLISFGIAFVQRRLHNARVL